MNSLRHILALTAILSLLGVSNSTEACEFCQGERGATLVLEYEKAPIVLYGHFENARIAAGGLEQGESDFVIEEALKSHDILKTLNIVKGKQILPIPRHIPDSKAKFLVFGEPYKGRVDAYKATQVVDGSQLRKYVEGALKLKDKNQPERLRFAFDFLNSPENEIAMDAYREFARADYKDYKDMAKTLDPKIISGWLKDAKTPKFRYGLYASLLGHCGKEEDAKFLLKMIDDPEINNGSGLNGLMAAYTMLEPPKGWAMLKELVRDKDKKFLMRYSGLATMRFLYESRPELVQKDNAGARAEIAKGVALVIDIPDMADFAIEDLRKWQRWEYCDQVAGLFGQKAFNTPHVRKAILRYALQCPKARAVAFVKEQIARDREWVEGIRDDLELESMPAKTTPTSK